MMNSWYSFTVKRGWFGPKLTYYVIMLDEGFYCIADVRMRQIPFEVWVEDIQLRRAALKVVWQARLQWDSEDHQSTRGDETTRIIRKHFSNRRGVA